MKQGNMLVERVGEGVVFGRCGCGATDKHGLLRVGFQIVQKRYGAHEEFLIGK